jgi:hypothetical protein
MVNIQIDAARPDQRDNRLNVSTDAVSRLKTIYTWIVPALLLALAAWIPFLVYPFQSLRHQRWRSDTGGNVQKSVVECSCHQWPQCAHQVAQNFRAPNFLLISLSLPFWHK